MHFYCTLKHEDHVAENNEQTQLVMQRKNTVRQSCAPPGSNKKGRASAT
jgi:hypothetical protein